MNVIKAEEGEEPRNLLIYVNNPLQFEKLLFKHVKILCKNRATLQGYVQTIDPVSESVVLVNFENDEPAKIQIIIGHAIEKLEVMGDEPKYVEMIKNLFARKNTKKSPEELKEIRNRVKSWLLKNRFPVSEKGDSLVVAGALTIAPPYDDESCYCQNEIILGKIQGLINNVPLNLPEWDTQ